MILNDKINEKDLPTFINKKARIIDTKIFAFNVSIDQKYGIYDILVLRILKVNKIIVEILSILILF